MAIILITKKLVYTLLFRVVSWWTQPSSHQPTNLNSRFFRASGLCPHCSSLMQLSHTEKGKENMRKELGPEAFPIWNQSVVPCPVLTVV